MTAKDKRLYRSGAAYRAAKIDPKIRLSQNSLAESISWVISGVIILGACAIVIADAMKGK